MRPISQLVRISEVMWLNLLQIAPEPLGQTLCICLRRAKVPHLGFKPTLLIRNTRAWVQCIPLSQDTPQMCLHDGLTFAKNKQTKVLFLRVQVLATSFLQTTYDIKLRRSPRCKITPWLHHRIQGVCSSALMRLPRAGFLWTASHCVFCPSYITWDRAGPQLRLVFSCIFGLR